jgi:peptide/nickel transport system permease protein
MVKYLIRRIIQSIPIMFGVTLLSFLLASLVPGGFVKATAFAAGLDASEVERLEFRLGIRDPIPVQYLRWLVGDDWMRWDSDGDHIADSSVLIPLTMPNGEALPPGDRQGILRGDFGISLEKRRPVTRIIFERFPATLELGITSLVVGLVIGIAIGVIAAVNQGKAFDHITRIMAVVFDAIPVFFLALILLLIFGSGLRILPLGGRCATTMDDSCPAIFQRLNYLILPTFVLAAGGISGFSRFMRASMLEVVSQDYIRTARAKGLTERTIWFRHGMRNALIPIATFLGPSIAFIWSGAAITETIFSWPGVGQTAVRAVGQRDLPLVMAITVFTAISTIIGYLISDVLYAMIDPRIRFD